MVSIQFSKLIVSLIIVLNIIFTASIVYVYLRIGSEPTTLIMSWFAFTTGELWLMASIKKKEIKKDDDC